jgi:DNA-binding PadR family transcriptional regulator
MVLHSEPEEGRERDVSIASDLIRGNTDTIILANLLEQDNYGYKINKSIQEKSGGRYELKEATLYTAFRRLEQNGCIESYWGDQETGARRRYYAITNLGRAVYEQNKREWQQTKELIDTLI